jgi:hypothetical protein
LADSWQVRQERGQPNEHFLSGKIFEQFFTKRLERYGERVGPLILGFGTFNKSTFPKVDDFMARLDPFLASLPKGFRYAIEIRNFEYLTPEYLGLLKSHNTAHVFNAWTRMPALDQQAQLSEAFAIPQCAHITYQQADRIVDSAP